MNHFNAAMAGITAAGIIAAIAYGRAPPPVVAAEPDRPSFDLIWHDAAVPTTIKAESLRPRFVQLEPVKTEPAAVVDIPEPAIRTRHRVHKRKHTERNICTRHNMKKVMVGKYRWRCRR